MTASNLALGKSRNKGAGARRKTRELNISSVVQLVLNLPKIYTKSQKIVEGKSTLSIFKTSG